MIGEIGERKSAVATPDGKSRKKKKKREIDCAPTHCKRTDPFESSHLAFSRYVECFLLKYGFLKEYCVSRVSISFVHNGNVRCRSL